MASLPETLEILIASAPPELRSELATAPELSSVVDALLASARSAWPTFNVDDRLFLAHVGAQLSAEESAISALSSLHASDLFLAFAAGNGDQKAISEFERMFLADASEAVQRMNLAYVAFDEAMQVVREKLFVRDADRAPKILQYSGRGPLAAWTRVAATRTALSLRRSAMEQTGRSQQTDPLLALASETDDPELEHLRAQYAEPFKLAFHDALAALSSQERNVLRLHLVDGLNIDQIGVIYQVHRATVARWIARSRESLAEETRKLMRERLQLSESEFVSIMEAMLSQLDVSIQRVLTANGNVSDSS